MSYPRSSIDRVGILRAPPTIGILKMRFLLLAGAIGPALFVTAVLIGASLRPDYDHTMQVMSALGATDSPNAILMNGLGFLPAGISIVVFGFSLFYFAPRSVLAFLGGFLVVIFGSGVFAAGVYSCDPGCVGAGTSHEAYLHIVASAVAFSSGILSCFVWGGAFRARPEWRSLSYFSFAAGLVSAGLLSAFNSASGTEAYPGIWQRLFIASLFGWCAIVGVVSYRLASEPQMGAENSTRI
jgi:hypothetical membrane protein